MKNLHATTGVKRRVLRSSSLAARVCHRFPKTGEQSAAERFSLLAKNWWEELASRQDWMAAAELGEMSATLCPSEAFGYENWAWALHKQGRTAEAYKLLGPLLRQLKLPGPPSGRAAYCLACFAAVLGKRKEARRWLRLASARALNKQAFREHVLREPELKAFWARLDSLN